MSFIKFSVEPIPPLSILKFRISKIIFVTDFHLSWGQLTLSSFLPRFLGNLGFFFFSRDNLFLLFLNYNSSWFFLFQMLVRGYFFQFGELCYSFLLLYGCFLLGRGFHLLRYFDSHVMFSYGGFP